MFLFLSKAVVTHFVGTSPFISACACDVPFVPELFVFSVVLIAILVVFFVFLCCSVKHVSRPGDKSSMHIIVKSFTGKTIPMRVEASDTIEQLKINISDIACLKPEQQQLFYNKEKLDDSRMLSDYDIHDDSILYLFCAMPIDTIDINFEANIDGDLSTAEFEQLASVFMEISDAIAETSSSIDATLEHSMWIESKNKTTRTALPVNNPFYYALFEYTHSHNCKCFHEKTKQLVFVLKTSLSIFKSENERDKNARDLLYISFCNGCRQRYRNMKKRVFIVRTIIYSK